MSRLPVLTGDKVIKAFSKAGWVAVRQKGSHVIMIKENSVVTLSIPVHKNRPGKKGHVERFNQRRRTFRGAVLRTAMIGTK